MHWAIGSNAEIYRSVRRGAEDRGNACKGYCPRTIEEGLLELYKKIRPGEPLAVESAESLIMSMFFDPRRYDLAKVGRYKFNKKLHASQPYRRPYTGRGCGRSDDRRDPGRGRHRGNP